MLFMTDSFNSSRKIPNNCNDIACVWVWVVVILSGKKVILFAFYFAIYRWTFTVIVVGSRKQKFVHEKNRDEKEQKKKITQTECNWNWVYVDVYFMCVYFVCAGIKARISTLCEVWGKGEEKRLNKWIVHMWNIKRKAWHIFSMKIYSYGFSFSLFPYILCVHWMRWRSGKIIADRFFIWTHQLFLIFLTFSYDFFIRKQPTSFDNLFLGIVVHVHEKWEKK
jgi:hypothetical protein